MSKKKIKFSIIVPVYNKGPHIKRCLDSILSQSYSHFEVIIVDDGSKDEGLDIIKKIDDKRIKLYNRKFPGPGGYTARNLGIVNSQFDWIAFLDADDTWNHNRLEKMVGLIINFPEASILTSGWYEFFDKDNIIEDFYYQRHKRRSSHYFDLLTILKDKQMICTSVAIIKRDLLLKVNGFNDQWKRGADLDLWVRVLLSGAKGAWLNEITAIYYKNSVNMVTEIEPFYLSPAMPTIKNFLIDYPNHNLKQEIQKYNNKLTYITLKRLMVTNLKFFGVFKKYFYFNYKTLNKIYIACFILIFAPKKLSLFLIKSKIL